VIKARIEACLAGLYKARYAYCWDEDPDRAILLLYDLIGDLQQVRAAMLDERFLRRAERAGALAGERPEADADEAY
jgi:hypothetical protein